MVKESIRYKSKWCIRRFDDDGHYLAWLKGFRDPSSISEFDGNVLLNEGITRLLNLLTGGGGTSYANSNAYLGVGDSATGENPAQTDLQAGANKTYKAMQATYPQISGQGVTWRSVFGPTDANYAWNEFTVANGSSGAAENLNRKVSAQGTKASGQTWTLDLTITFS